MPSPIRTSRPVARSIIAVAAVLLAAAACQVQPRTAAEPIVSSLIVRNTSVFDVNVYAVPAEDAKPVWLGTVPPSGTKSIDLRASALRTGGNLVVQTRSIGASRSWTSSAVHLDEGFVAVLDLAADEVGDCSGSVLQAVSALGVHNVIR